MREAGSWGGQSGGGASSLLVSSEGRLMRGGERHARRGDASMRREIAKNGVPLQYN